MRRWLRDAKKEFDGLGHTDWQQIYDEVLKTPCEMESRRISKTYGVEKRVELIHNNLFHIKIALMKPRVEFSLPEDRCARVCEGFDFKHLAVSLVVSSNLGYEWREHFDAFSYLLRGRLCFSAFAFAHWGEPVDRTLGRVQGCVERGFRWPESAAAETGKKNNLFHGDS